MAPMLDKPLLLHDRGLSCVWFRSRHMLEQDGERYLTRSSLGVAGAAGVAWGITNAKTCHRS